MKTADQLERLLTLVPFLQANPGLTAAEVAEHYKTTPRQIILDLDTLWYCGPSYEGGELIEVNIDEVRHGAPIQLSNADYLTRPMRLSVEEAFALVVALTAIRELVPSGQASSVDSALAKLGHLTGGRPVPRVAIQMASGSSEVRRSLEDAASRRQRVRLTYDGINRGHTTTPVVEPHEISFRDGVAYLVAWSLERDGWRNYRLDRVVGVDVLEEASEERPAPTDTWVDAGGERVELALRPEAAWLVEYDPTEEVERHADGSVEAVFRMVDPAWLRRRLLQLGAAVAAVAPTELARPAADAAREALELHNLVTVR